MDETEVRRYTMGNRLKAIREEKRMTQEELSARSGVSRQTIVSLENNESYNTTTGTLVKLADALGVSIEQFFSAERG